MVVNEELHTSINDSTRKKKKKKMKTDSILHDVIMEPHSDLKPTKKKNKTISPDNCITQCTSETHGIFTKKKKKPVPEEGNPLDSNTNQIVTNKKKNKLVPEEVYPQEPETNQINSKKKKKKSESQQSDVSPSLTKTNEIVPKKKKKKTTSEESDVPPLVNETNKVAAKKKKQMITEESDVSPHVPETNEIVLKKKKKKTTSEESDVPTPVNETNKAATKKKKQMITEESDVSPLVPETNKIVPKKKKRKITTEESDVFPLVNETNKVAPKKKKNKMTAEENDPLVTETNEVPAKKKKKITAEGSDIYPLVTESNETVLKNKVNATVAEESEAMNEIITKKKKKKIVEESDVSPLVPVTNEIVRKQKKNNIVLCDVSPPLSETSQVATKKMKNVGALSAAMKDVPHVLQDEVPTVDMSGSRKPKKKKKKAKAASFVTEDTTGMIEVDPEIVDVAHVNISKSKMKIKSFVSDPEKQVACANGSLSTSGASKIVTKKKTKGMFIGDIESSENSTELGQGHHGGEGQLNGVNATSEITSLKKKKQRKGGERTVVSLSENGNTNTASGDEVNHDKGKKKKKMAGALVNSTEDKINSLKKETVANVAEQVETSDQEKKAGSQEASRRQAATGPQITELFLQTTHANMRDRAIPPTIPVQQATELGDLKFGQWDTAAFQSSDQKTKFLRLMGGFKKGNQAALTPSANHMKANMALGKTEEKVLERNLQTEFDKALNWRKNSGIGLGFQTVQKKTFHIDTSVSRSVKFE
ncbi:lysine-rich nucleolar protein 1 [Pelodytes ibericus]